LGLINYLITGSLSEEPFESEPLDILAKQMKVQRILNRGKLERYYRPAFLRTGGAAYLDRIFFDSTYLDLLTPEEFLAVGAHELTHIKERHGEKRFLRVFIPSIVVACIVAILAFYNYEVIRSIIIFRTATPMFSVFAMSIFSFLLASFASFFLNAKWNRAQEIKCDLSASNGEAMISALNKLYSIRKQSKHLRWLPALYPSQAERIAAIRQAKKGNNSS
jgi:Zn-dependent protease with chaperone function